MIVALLATLAIQHVQVQECGPVAKPSGRYVAWIGTDSADLSRYGIGQCNGLDVWIQPSAIPAIDIEVHLP